jgi:KRAB domain-containing zinc finger protein
MFNHNFRYVASDRISQSLQNERNSDKMPSCHGDGTSADDISKQNEKFAMETNIKNVLNNTSKKGEFYCNVCSMKFDKIHLLRLHAYFCGNKQEKIKVRMVGKKKEYECPICGKIFSDRRGIERHGPVHSGIKAYECTVCGRSYTQKGHLELHMKKHNDNFFERFECPFCFKIFEKKDRFVKHKETHSSGTPYTCNVCNNSVQSLDDLHGHFKTHAHHNFYYVENKSEIRSLDTTKKRVPDDLKSMTMPLQVFDSDKLQELSSSQLMLKEQEQTLCADGQFIYICQICRKQFQSWEVLLEHIDRHFGLSSKFKCETCDDEFDTIHNLKQHINEHREKFEYAGMCQVCMKYFEVDEDLSEHFKIHSRLAQKRSFYIKNPKYRSCVANRN